MTNPPNRDHVSNREQRGHALIFHNSGQEQTPILFGLNGLMMVSIGGER